MEDNRRDYYIVCCGKRQKATLKEYIPKLPGSIRCKGIELKCCLVCSCGVIVFEDYDRNNNLISRKKKKSLNMKNRIEVIPNPKTGIYFIQGVITSKIKIEYLNDVNKALREMQKYSPDKLIVIGYCFGSKKLCDKINLRFNSQRNFGGWYNPHPGLMDYIKEVTRDVKV